MPEKSYSRDCKTGDNNPGNSTDKGFLRGQKIKIGLLYKLAIGIGILAISFTIAIPDPKDQINKTIKKISTASLDQIDPTELAAILNNQNADTSNQAHSLQKEIKGKIVEWELEILVVVNLSDHYKILTKPTAYYPGALLTLYAQNSQQMTYMENVKPGAKIKFKGEIAGILKGRIKINPALLG